MLSIRPLTAEGAATLLRFPNLRHLQTDLVTNTFFLSKLPQLTAITLAAPPRRYSGGQCTTDLFVLQALPNLQYLSLQHLRIDDSGTLLALTQLQHVDLCACTFTPISQRPPAAARPQPQLARLDVEVPGYLSACSMAGRDQHDAAMQSWGLLPPMLNGVRSCFCSTSCSGLHISCLAGCAWLLAVCQCCCLHGAHAAADEISCSRPPAGDLHVHSWQMGHFASAVIDLCLQLSMLCLCIPSSAPRWSLICLLIQ